MSETDNQTPSSPVNDELAALNDVPPPPPRRNWGKYIKLPWVIAIVVMVLLGWANYFQFKVAKEDKAQFEKASKAFHSKDEAVESLTKELNEKKIELETLKSNFSQKEAEISKLQAKIERLEKAAAKKGKKKR